MAATTNNGIVLPVELLIKNLLAVANSLKEFAGKNILEDSLGGKKVNSELLKILTSLSLISAKAKTALTTNSDFSSILKDVDKVSLGMAKILDIVNGLSFKDLKIPEEISNQIGILLGRILQLNNGLSTFKASLKDKLISNDSFLLDLKRALPKDATKILEKNYDELYKSVKNGMSKVNSELAFLEGLFRKNQEMITQNSSGKANFSQWGALDFLLKAFALLPKDKSKYSDLQKLLSEYMEVGAGEDGKTLQFTTFKNGAAGLSLFFEKVLATYSLSDTLIQEIRTRMQDAMKKLNRTQAEIMRDMASDKELGALIMANKSYEDLTRSKIHYEGQQKDYSSSEAAVGDLRARAEAFKSILAPLEAALKEVDALSKTLAESLKAPTTALEEILKEILSTALTSPLLSAALKAGNDAIVSLTKSIDEGKLRLQQLDTVIGKMNGISNFVNRYVGLYAIVRKVTTAVKNAFNNIKELDKTITNIAVVTNMSQKDLWGKIGEYTQIAQQFGVATQNVYTVSLLFYQQGLQTSQVMALTSETLKMAKISGMEYSDAANAMTVAIRAFKIEMTEAQLVTDTYSALAAKFAVSSAEIANAMEKTASSAANVGMSLQSTSAFISVMEQTTRESAQNIGSALKSIISRYGEMKASPKDILNVDGEEVAFNKVDTALKSVGISIKDSAGLFRDFDDVIIELARKWDTLDNNTQRYIATVMAGNRQQSRFIALVSNYDELSRAINVANNSENASMVLVAKTMDSLESKTNLLKNAWQQLYLSLKIEDGLKGTYEILTNILKTIGKLGMLKGVLPTLSTLIGFGLGTKGLINTGRKWIEDRKKKIQGNINSQEEEVKKIKLDMEEAKKLSDQLDEYILKELIKKVKVIVEGTNLPSNLPSSPIGLKIDELDSVETLKLKIKNAETLVEKLLHLKELDKNSQEYADARKDMNKYAWNIGTTGNINAEKRLGELKAALAKAEGGQPKTEELAKPAESKQTVPTTALPALSVLGLPLPVQGQLPLQPVILPLPILPQALPALVPVQFLPSTNFSAYMQNLFKDIFSKAGGTDGVIDQEEITARMKEAYANAPEEMKAEFDKMGLNLSLEAGEAGELSVRGFTQEIQAGSATTAAAGKELSDAFITAVKSTLGIASPSKVMAAFGQNAGGTFNDNVKGCIEGAAGAGTELAEAAINAIDTVIELNKGKINFNDVFAPLKVALLSLTEGKKTLLEKVEQETTAKLGGRSFLTESVGADGLTDSQRKAFAEKEAALPGNEAYLAKIQELALKYGGRNVQNVYKESSQLYSQYRLEGEDITKQIKTLENLLYTSVSNNRDKYLSEASRLKQREYDKAVLNKLNDTEEGKEYRRLEQEEREMLFRQLNELLTLQTSKAFKKSKKDALAESLTALQKRHAQEKNELKGYKDVSYQRLTRAKSTLEYSDPELLNLLKQLEQQESADIAAEVNKNEDLIKLKAKLKEIFDKRKVADETSVQADKDIRELDKLKALSEQPRKALEAEKQATIASNKEVLAILSEHDARVNEINNNYDIAYSDVGIAETTLRENAQKRIDRRLKRSQTRPEYVEQGIKRKEEARAAMRAREEAKAVEIKANLLEESRREAAEANDRVIRETATPGFTPLDNKMIEGLGKNTVSPRVYDEFIGTPKPSKINNTRTATLAELLLAAQFETPAEKVARELALIQREEDAAWEDYNKPALTPFEKGRLIALAYKQDKQLTALEEAEAARNTRELIKDYNALEDEREEKHIRALELRAQYEQEDERERQARKEAHLNWAENRLNRQEIAATRNSAAERKSNAKIEKTGSRLLSGISAYEQKYGITKEDSRHTEGSETPENEPKADTIITVGANVTPARETVEELKDEIAGGSTVIPVSAKSGASSEDLSENKIGDALENVAEDVKDAAETNAEESGNDKNIVRLMAEDVLNGDNPADAAGAAATAAAEELVADLSSAENKKDENGPVDKDDLARESTLLDVRNKLGDINENNEKSEDIGDLIKDGIQNYADGRAGGEEGSSDNEQHGENPPIPAPLQLQLQERQSRRERKQEEREKRKLAKQEYKEKLKTATGEERKLLKKEHHQENLLKRQEKLLQWQNSTAYRNIGIATNFARMVAPFIAAAGAAHEDKEGEEFLGKEMEVSKVVTGIGNGISGAAQGASMGMAFGPVGAAIGAIGGFLLTGFSAIKDGLEVTDKEKLLMRKEEAKKKDDAALLAKAKETELNTSLEQLKQLKKNLYNSEDDMKAYLEAMNNMAQLYPLLISAYDAAGNAIISISEAERELIKVRIEAARAAADAAVANAEATEMQLKILTKFRNKVQEAHDNQADHDKSEGWLGYTSTTTDTKGMVILDKLGKKQLINGDKTVRHEAAWGLFDDVDKYNYKGVFDEYMKLAIELGDSATYTQELIDKYGDRLQIINDAVARHTGENGAFDESVLYTQEELEALSSWLALTREGTENINLHAGWNGIRIAGSEYDKALLNMEDFNQDLKDGERMRLEGTEKIIDEFIQDNKELLGTLAENAREYFGWDDAPTALQLDEALAMINRIVTLTENTYKALRKLAGMANAALHFLNEIDSRGSLTDETRSRLSSNALYSNLAYQSIELEARSKGYETSIDWRDSNKAEYENFAGLASEDILNLLTSMSSALLDLLEEAMSKATYFRSADSLLNSLGISKYSKLGLSIAEQFIEANKENRESILRTVYAFDKDGNVNWHHVNLDMEGLEAIGWYSAPGEHTVHALHRELGNYALDIAYEFAYGNSIISEYASYFNLQLVEINKLAENGSKTIAKTRLESLYSLFTSLKNITNDQILSDLFKIINNIDFSDFTSVNEAIKAIEKYGKDNNFNVNGILNNLKTAESKLIYNINTLAESITTLVMQTADEIDNIASTNKSGLSLGKALETYSQLAAKLDESEFMAFDEVFTFDTITGKYIYTSLGMAKSIKKQLDGLKEKVELMEAMIAIDENISDSLELNKDKGEKSRKTTVDRIRAEARGRKKIKAYATEDVMQYLDEEIERPSNKYVLYTKEQMLELFADAPDEVRENLINLVEEAFSGGKGRIRMSEIVNTAMSNVDEQYRYEDENSLLQDITATFGADMDPRQRAILENYASLFINSTDYSDRTWEKFIEFMNKLMESNEKKAENAQAEVEEWNNNLPNLLYAQIDWSKLALGTDFNGGNLMLANLMAEAMGFFLDEADGHWKRNGRDFGESLGWDELIEEYLDFIYDDNEEAKENARAQILGLIDKSKSDLISTAITEILNGEGQLLSDTSMTLLKDAGELEVNNGIILAGLDYVLSALALYNTHRNTLLSIAERNKEYAEIINKAAEKNNSLISTLSSGASMDADAFGNFLTLFNANLDDFVSVGEDGLLRSTNAAIDVDLFGKVLIKNWSAFIQEFESLISDEILNSFEYQNAYSTYVDGLIDLNTLATDLVKKQYDDAFSAITKFNLLNVSLFNIKDAKLLADNGAGTLELDNGILTINDTIQYALNAIELFSELSALSDAKLYERTGWTSEDLARNWKTALTILSDSREVWTSVGNNLSNITTDLLSTLIEKGGLKINDIDKLFTPVGNHYVMSLEKYALELGKSMTLNGEIDLTAYSKAMNEARLVLVNNLTGLDWTKVFDGTATSYDLDTFKEGLLDNLTALDVKYGELIDEATGEIDITGIVDALSKVDGALADHIKETIAEVLNNILSSISNASEYVYQGTNSISDMQKFVDEYNKLVDDKIDISAFKYDTNLDQFTLDASVLNKYIEALRQELEKLGMSGDAIEEYIKDLTITLMRLNMDITSIFDDSNLLALKKAISSLANNIKDYMEFSKFDLTEINLEELPDIEEVISQRQMELAIAYNLNEIDWNTYLERFGAVENEVMLEMVTTSADTIVELLYRGGENAVKILKLLKGDELTSDEVSAVYNAGMNRINATQEALELGEGTILTGMAALIAKVSDGIEVIELADGSAVIKEITSMADAYSRLYATMKEDSARTISSLNSLYAKFLTSIDLPEVDAISVLNDAMGMSYEALGEMLAKYGVTLESAIANSADYGLRSLGNGLVLIYDFKAFASKMHWSPDSEAYTEAYKAYNDSLIALDKKIGENITEEVKAITEAKAGDRINVTYLVDKLGMAEAALNRVYFNKLGASVNDGILKISSETNIPELVNTIAQLASENAGLLPEELAELADAVNDYINGIIDLINNGITGSLTNVQALELQSWADSLGISLDFTKTADGLKLSLQQAIQLYNEIKNIDSILARLVFDKLNESLTETNEHYKSISDILARIIELEKIAPDARSDEYKLELDLAKQILAIRSTSEDEGFNFMSNKIPGALNNPINYYNNWALAIQTLNNALNKTNGADKGLINYLDWYNIVTEMNNIAALGQDFEVAGVKLDGSMEAAAALIEKGAAALTADSTGNIKVSLEKIGVDFLTGSGEMSSGINEGIAAMAKSLVKMLDGMIRMLEVIVQMEELGDITGEDNHIDFGDFFVTGDDGFAGLNTANTNITKWIDSLLSLDDKESDLYKALDLIKVNNKSLRDLLTSAKEGKLNIDDALALTSVLDSMWLMYQSGDWDLDNLYDSLAQIAELSGLGGELVIDLDDTTLIIGGGQITLIEWNDVNTKKVLERWKTETGQTKDDLVNEINKYHSGEAVSKETLEYILEVESKYDITTGGIVANINGKKYTFEGEEEGNIPYWTALLNTLGLDVPDYVKDMKTEAAETKLETDVKVGQEVIVSYDKNGIHYRDNEGTKEAKSFDELALNWYNDLHPNGKITDFSDNLLAKKEAYWHFGQYVLSEVTVTVGDTKVDLKNPGEVRDKVKAELDSGAWKDEIAGLTLNEKGELELQLGEATITISGAEIADENGKIDTSKVEAYIRNNLLGMDLGLKETISEGIKEAFTEIDDGKIQQLREAITETSTAFNELKADIALNTPTVDVDTTTAASKISSLQTKWDNLTTSMRSNITGGGSAGGNVGMAHAKGTLMGELGPELVVSNGRYFVAGQGGPEMVDLADDAIVFNHLQTKSLLKNGTSSGRGKAITNERNAVSYAKGNIHGGPAKASASAALNALKLLRAQWKALESLTTKDLAGKGGGGGGGGDPKAFLKDLEKWYNWLQQIAQLEKEITAEETKRSKILSDMIAHGADYYTSLIKSLDALLKELVVHQSLTDSLEEYFNQRREALNNLSAFSALYGFGESGLLYYKSGALQWLSDLVGRNATTGEANYTAEEQYKRLVDAGFGEFMKYDSSGNEIKQEGDWYATAVQAFWDKIDSDKEEMQSLHDSIEEHKKAVLESQTKMNEILRDIEDNQITVELKVLKAVEDSRLKQIDEVQKERNAIEKSSKALIDGLNQLLKNEQDMYSKLLSLDELGKLLRQLAILLRSGGSASQIADLQLLISDKLLNMYFDAQQKQIDALLEASDNQLQRLDALISLMTESLAYEKENGLLWQAVSELLAKSPEEIMAFILENTKDYASKSATELIKQLREDLFDIERFKKFQEKVEDGMNGLINQYGDETAKAKVKAEKEEAEKAISSEGNFVASTAGSGSGSGGGSNSGENNIKKKVPEKSTLRYKFTYNGQEYKYSGKDAEKNAKNGIAILAKNEYDKLVKDYPLSGTNYYNWIINKHKKEALDSLQQFDQGGMNYETGLAMLHGTSSKPESVLTASQTSILRNDILSNKPTSLLSLLTDFRDAYNNISNATNSVVGASDGGIIIENATVEMNVSQIANDYDAQRAGEQALDKMLQIARKTLALNRIGR